MPTDFAVQTTDAIDRPTAANGQVSHVEIFRRVFRVAAAQRQQIVKRYAKFLLGITAQVLSDKVRGKTVKTG